MATQTIELTAYRPHDLPACLAAAGLLRVLGGYAGIPVRLSWAADRARLHLPDDTTPVRVATALAAMAVERADAPEWGVYDLCDDAEAWEAKAREVFADADAKRRGRSDALAACACYLGGAGGRSPLLLTARNMTPGRWARKAAAGAQSTDWPAHFRAWRTDQGSWQGWRRPDEPGADHAAVWLALEGLAYWPCAAAHTWSHPHPDHRIEAGRRGVACPGWDCEARVWACPLPADPVGADAIRTAIARPELRPHARFARGTYAAGGYALNCFESGVTHAPDPDAFPGL